MLNPTLSDRDIDRLVAEAASNGFWGVCVPPFWVKRAQREIDDSPVQLITVVGFPLGYQMTESKLLEASLALRDGANEIDMVMNISAFKMNHPWFKIELAKMAKLVHEHEAILKVIIETAYLTKEEIQGVALTAKDAGADFIKTSTGFAATGANAEDIALLRGILPSHVGIKASGGIKSLSQLVEMMEAGADRIGTSSGVAIMEEASQRTQ